MHYELNLTMKVFIHLFNSYLLITCVFSVVLGSREFRQMKGLVLNRHLAQKRRQISNNCNSGDRAP